jgi:hypothetical protein
LTSPLPRALRAAPLPSPTSSSVTEVISVSGSNDPALTNPFDSSNSTNPFDSSYPNPMNPFDSSYSNPTNPFDSSYSTNPFDSSDPLNPFESSDASGSRTPSPTARTLEEGNGTGLREDMCRCGRCAMCQVDALVDRTVVRLMQPSLSQQQRQRRQQQQQQQQHRAAAKRFGEVHDRIGEGDSEDTREPLSLPGSPSSEGSEDNTPLPLELILDI